MPGERKQALLRGMAASLRNEDDYVFAPDMGTDEECMAWIRDEIGRVVALPRELGGIPLDEIGATGWGIANVAEIAVQHCDFELDGARVAVQGFGAVGRHAARFLAEKGAILVAAADSRGAIHDPHGLDIEALTALKQAGRSVAEAATGERIAAEAVVDVDCEIWIPAARPDVVHEGNVDRLRTKLVIQGANIPFTPGAERILHERGVLCVPDFIANAGGVICAAMEYHGATESTALASIEEKLRRNTRLVLDTASSEGRLPREAAVAMATQRVRRAMEFRRYSLFSTAPGFV
jgi:glutamate dehydrogenase (NAD(P)+)